MLLWYNNKRFRVSDIVWENFKTQYPRRAEKIKILKEEDIYFSMDELVRFTEPCMSETKETIIKNYIYADDKYTEHTLDNNYNMMERYFGAKEMARRIGEDLILFDPEKNLEDVEKVRRKIEKQQKEYHDWLKENGKF